MRYGEVEIIDNPPAADAQPPGALVRDNLPEQAPLFPQMRDATGIEVTYVEYPGGPPPPYITGTLREILAAQNEPLLHISFLVNGHRHTTLISLVALTQRGLPNDYEQLKAMFPDLRWSAS